MNLKDPVLQSYLIAASLMAFLVWPDSGSFTEQRAGTKLDHCFGGDTFNPCR